jgi:peptidoglycan pentaglycine glycine transferase (the first glycine)
MKQQNVNLAASGPSRVNMRVISSLDSASLDDASWDTFVTSSPDGHLLQTSTWGALKMRFGWEMDRLAVLNNDEIVAGAQVLYRSLPSRLVTLAYVPMGPLVDWQNRPVVQALLDGLLRLASSRRAFCLRMEPSLLENPELGASLAAYGLQVTEQRFQPRRTILIDIDGPEEQIMARMHSKTRYNIRLATRKGVEVRDGNVDDLEAFQHMLEDTTERDDFQGHDPAYYRAIYDLFVPKGQARFLLATHQDIPLAGVLAFVTGNRAWYMYGASSNQYRNLMPNYLLQWEAIQWARSKGCLTYDLWGIPDEEEQVLENEFAERTDGLWGVYRFKRGFGGRVVRFLSTYDQVCSRPIYWMYTRTSGLLERFMGETWHRRLRSG